MSAQLLRCAVLLAAGVVGGCATGGPRPVDFSDAPRTFSPESYETIRSDWTRHAKAVRDIGTIIEVWATFKSAEFRQAYIESYAELYVLPEPERAALRKAQMEAAQEVYEFHVTAQSTRDKWVDLDQEDSPWKITLSDGSGREVAPASIEAKRYPEMYEMQFFPNRTDFTRTYLVRFPRGAFEQGRPGSAPAGGKFVLRIAGPLARVEMEWLAR